MRFGARDLDDLPRPRVVIPYPLGLLQDPVFVDDQPDVANTWSTRAASLHEITSDKVSTAVDVFYNPRD